MWEGLGFVIILLGMAASYGASRQRAIATKEELDKHKEQYQKDIDSLHNKVDEINRFLRDAATERALKGR